MDRALAILEANATHVPARLSALIISAYIAVVSVALWRAEWNDYRDHSREWRVILEGGEPWRPGTMNTYGPLFNGLAGLAVLHPLAPKVVFCSVWFAGGVFLTGLGFQRGASLRQLWLLAAFVFLNPFFWTNVAINGQFDILVAALSLSGIHLCARGRQACGGVLFGLGALLKYYPLLLLPYVAIDRGRAHWKPVLFGVATVAAGMAVGWAMWGSSVFGPLGFASDRGSKLLSVFAFLRGRFSPLHLATDSPNVDFLSVPLLVLAMTAVLLACLHKRIPRTYTALAGAVCVFTVYKVGHQQYLLVVFLIVGYIIAADELKAASRWLKIALACYLTWLIMFDLAYCISGWNNRGFGLPQWPLVLVREFAGLPTFLLGAWVVLECLVQDWNTGMISVHHVVENAGSSVRPMNANALPAIDQPISVGNRQ